MPSSSHSVSANQSRPPYSIPSYEMSTDTSRRRPPTSIVARYGWTVSSDLLMWPRAVVTKEKRGTKFRREIAGWLRTGRLVLQRKARDRFRRAPRAAHAATLGLLARMTREESGRVARG